MARKGTFSDTHDPTVYAYGLVPTKRLPKEAVQSLFEANKFWNSLVAIHNKTRGRYEKALRDAHAEYLASALELDSANTDVDAAYDAKRNAQLKVSSRDKNHPLLVEANNNIRNARKVRSSLWIDKLMKLREAAQQAMDTKTFNDETNRKFKDAYAVAQVSGTSKDAIRSSFDEARKKALQYGGSLNFKKFDGTGRWVFRFRASGKATDGITVNEFFSQGRRRPLQVAAPITQDKSRRLKTAIKVTGGRRADDKTYVDFDLIYHRPLPSDAVIVNAEVVRRRIGDRFKYMLSLTLRVPKKSPFDVRLKSAAGIDIGVRENPDGSIQVAVIATASGTIEQVFVPRRVLLSLERVQALQWKLSDSAAELGKHIKTLLCGGAVVEGGHNFAKFISAIALMPPNRTMAYEQAYKLGGIAMRTPNTLPAEVETALVDWLNSNFRNYREMHNLRAKSLGERKHYYRNVAARLCAVHSVIGFEEIDLSKFAKAEDTDGKPGNKLRTDRFRASVSELRGAIENAARRTGTKIFRWSDVYTSMTCNICGAIKKTSGATRYWDCDSCQSKHDLDENAAKNILGKAIKSVEEKSVFEVAAESSECAVINI